MKKILITYATAGEGHKRAAFAIKGAFDALAPDNADIKIIDTLDYTNDFFKWSYPRIYLFLVNYVPTIWGFFYYLLDIRWINPIVRFVRRLANKRNTRALEKFLINAKPDIVITTHFLASEVISSLKAQGKLRSTLITCVTDFRMHSFWFSHQTDFFCVGFNETRQDLVKKWRFDARKVIISGMPVHPKFYEKKNKETVCNKLSLRKGMFTVLITGGGFGVGPILRLVKALIKMKEEFQILVVCGHNEKLQQQINQLSAIRYPPSAIKLITYGFIDYVDELMTIADLGITKAGGLITSEAIAKELPLVIMAPIPGQETRNLKLLLNNNAAFRLRRTGCMKYIIKKVCADRSILEGMKENIRKIKREDPAANIARFALGV